MIYQGEDKTINITVEQTFVNRSGVKTTVPIDLTTFVGYMIWLYAEETNEVIAKYSKNAGTGYELIDEVDPSNGLVAIFLDKTVTGNAPIGMVYGELKTSLTDADYSQGIYETVVQFPIDDIVPSVTNGVIPPS